jgi:hypothetical protein
MDLILTEGSRININYYCQLHCPFYNVVLMINSFQLCVCSRAFFTELMDLFIS